MNRNSPLLVELFGQPGAGKSTLVQSVAAGSELPTRANLSAAWGQQSLFVKAGFVARAMLDGVCLSSAIQLVIRARLVKADSLSRLFRLLVKSHWLRSQAGPMLLEEGHLQDLWSIFYSAGRTEPQPHLLAPLIGCLYQGLDAQIVFLDVGAEEVFERIRGRAHGKSRLDRLAEQELRQHAIATSQLPHRIADAAGIAGLKVRTVDASLPIETTVGLLRAAVQNF